MHLDLLYPVSEEPCPGSVHFPVVVYTHGGGYSAGSRKLHGNMGNALNRLRSKGFCVASVEYRLRSKEYASGGSTVLVGDCVTDSKDAVRYLSKHRDELCVDTERLFFFGDSAGGQIAQMLLLSHPDVLPGAEELSGYGYNAVAGVSWYGPCDFEKTELFNPDGRANFRDRFGHRIVRKNMSPAEKAKAIQAVSPIKYLTKDSPPLLMVQGNKDMTIPVHHAHCMFERAEELGAPVELLIVKNAGHNFRRMDPEKKVPINPSKGEIIKQTVEYFVKFLV